MGGAISAWALRQRSRCSLLVDLTIALAATALQVGQAAGGGSGNVVRELLLAVALVSGLLLVARRRAPLAVALAATAAYSAFYLMPPVAVAAYTLGAYGRNRQHVFSVCAIACGGVLLSPWTAVPAIGRIVTSAAVVVAPALLGLYVGARRSLLENLRERAERLEREQHLLAQKTRVEERTRIAREMHDVVAHRVSLMVLHAGALEVAADDPERVASAAGLIRGIGREALDELRAVIGVLRVGDDGVDGRGDDAAPLAPQPTVDDIAPLVAQSRAAGTPVTLCLDPGRRPLAGWVERTAYRVVQEALTNVHKHAGGAPTVVTLDYTPHELEVTVTNARPLRPPADLLPPGGHGLVGLRERVRLAGGRFEFGPRLDGGFGVRAVLPAVTPPAPGREWTPPDALLDRGEPASPVPERSVPERSVPERSPGDGGPA